MNESSFNADVVLPVRLDFIRPRDQGLSGKTPGDGPGAWELISSTSSEGPHPIPRVSFVCRGLSTAAPALEQVVFHLFKALTNAQPDRMHVLSCGTMNPLPSLHPCKRDRIGPKSVPISQLPENLIEINYFAYFWGFYS